MVALRVDLPDDLHDFVERQSRLRGCTDPAQTIRQLLAEAHAQMNVRDALDDDVDRLEALLDEADHTPEADMTATDWNRIRQEVVRRHHAGTGKA